MSLIKDFAYLSCLILLISTLKMLLIREDISSKHGEAVINSSLLAAARSRELRRNRRSQLDAARPRCCGRGFFAYFLFPKKVGEKAVSLFFYRGHCRTHLAL
jgi:hypothetical protein